MLFATELRGGLTKDLGETIRRCPVSEPLAYGTSSLSPYRFMLVILPAWRPFTRFLISYTSRSQRLVQYREVSSTSRTTLGTGSRPVATRNLAYAHGQTKG